MAKSVNEAFTKFNTDIVNLESERTKKARKSRDWLITQLESLPEKIDDFPMLFDGMHMKFGSFARNTKIRPLDDIDLLLTFHANGATYWEYIHGQRYILNIPNSATNLIKLSNDTNTLNSIKVVNKLVSSLNNIEQYKSADIHRNQEAATLKLSSYEWNFDIVPAFHTDRDFYLIPDGSGEWKATNPIVDQNRITEINQKHDGKILQLIRTLKYWNKYAKMPTIPSYLFENMVLNYFDSKDKIEDYIDYNIKYFWYHLKSAIYNSVPDPKGFQSDLNNLSYDEKVKISEKAEDTYNKACEAYDAELNEKNQEKAINKWRTIFGDSFPKYE
jgi:predicted nucleotidyltransferase